jgi:hypothetical protein
VRAACDPHQRPLALGDARQRLRREYPLLDVVVRGPRLRARRREELVVAAAGMHRVVDERFAVRRQRHPPDQAVQPAREDIAFGLRRALRKPDRIDQLQQHAVLVARPGRVRVDRQLPAVDGGNGLVHLICARPAQRAEAVVVRLHRNLETGRVGRQQLGELGFAGIGNPERVHRAALEDGRHARAQQLPLGRRRVPDHDRAHGRRRFARKRRARFGFVAPHAAGERELGQRIQPQHAAHRTVVIRHLHAFEQRATRLRRRHVDLAQQLAALLRALDRIQQHRHLSGRQVQDFVAPRFHVERQHAVGERLQRVLARFRERPQRGEQAARPQVGKARHARILRVAHAGLADLAVEAGEPLGAFAHQPSGRGEVAAERRLQRRAAGEQQRARGRQRQGGAQRAQAPSIPIASRFDHEKHFTAASRAGSQRLATCSSGASVTGTRCGRAKLNTCSVLCVVPGAKRCRHCG